MATYTWDEIINLLKTLKEAEENDDVETIAHITNVLPDEIRFWGDEIHIVL